MVSIPLPALPLVCVLLLVHLEDRKKATACRQTPAITTGAAHHRPPAPPRLAPTRLAPQPHQEAWPRRYAPPSRRRADARRVVAACRRGRAAHARPCLRVTATLHGHRHPHVRLVQHRLCAIWPRLAAGKEAPHQPHAER